MKNLRELRKAQHLSMKQLGNIVGVSESTVSLYENDKRQPDYDTLRKIAGYFHVTTDFLLDVEADTVPLVTGDDEIKFALFGTTDIDDELYEDVKRIAKIQKQLKEEKEKARLLKEKADN